MSKIFIHIYEWFERHKAIFYSVLFLSVAILGLMASQISFQENITNFFNESGEKNKIFENVSFKDKIVVMLTGDEPDNIIASAEIFEEKLSPLIDEGEINSIVAYADDEAINKCISFVYDNLPIFLTDEDYSQLNKRILSDSISKSIENVYNMLVSPSGMIVGDILMKDPLCIGTHILKRFEGLNPDLDYEIYEGRLFTSDLSTMLMFIQPANGIGDTGNNDKLISALEDAENIAEIVGVNIECIGGPIVAVHNARQIKNDTAITLGMAILFILLVIYLSFKNKWSIPLIIIPPLFGIIFALAMVWLTQGEISTIAIGAGTVVLGISLSYSIHIVAHLNHIHSPKKIIEELTTPLTLGCFTTIGAFAALMFTSSSLLQDMGLFSVFALIGTTLFCLIFMPQFLRGVGDSKKSLLLEKIEGLVGYKYEKNRWIVIPVILITLIALFFYNDVKFDDNMSNINFMPQHIIDAESRSKKIFGDESKDVYIITGNKDIDSLTYEYAQINDLMAKFKDEGKIEEVTTICDFVVSPEEQKKRIDKWNNFWIENGSKTLSLIEDESRKYGFRQNTFSQFSQLITKEYSQCHYTAEEIKDIPIISDWINSSDEYLSILSRVSLEDKHKQEIYSSIDSINNSIVIDRAYFASKMVESTSEDFNYILLVSSLIVFFALLISYGRIEITLLTFLPMAISWVIILGLMAIFDIKFNIVNIILATFIFGIGDDFSIFIMDGLLQEYKNGKKVLAAHKTAIFFSAFTAIVGMGVLIFAQHPALKSIALISVLGLSVVVLVSYTIQPMLFKLLVTKQTEKGGFPYTLGAIFNTIYCFSNFLIGCIFIQMYMLVLMLLPIKKEKKKLYFHKIVFWITRLYNSSSFTTKTIRINPFKEDYNKPALIIANHQSFIDILLMLSVSPKMVMVTNSWVWNSPFFGWIVKYADFHHSADGYEVLAERLKKRVEEGYSVVIFPEGTRSADCSIQRFHKGAFYLAQLLKLDILPMIIYGAGQISAKKQGFYIKSGILAIKTMERVKYGDTKFGVTYQEQAKNFRKWYIEQYKNLNDELGRTYNSYFRTTLIKNYIYKGPVIEWYMRIKCRIDGYYDFWDRIIPRNASVTDIGCGYGQMDFMLALLSPERDIVAVDYDNDKIELAKNSFLAKKLNVKFIYADMLTLEFPKSDVFLFNDSLHYVDAESQREVLIKAIKNLNRGGLIIVRDGDVSNGKNHEKIVNTEIWSTEILKFNKTENQLCFVSADYMRQIAEENNMKIKIRSCDKDSSETLYILTNNEQK